MDKLIQIADSLFAIAQNGLLFTKDAYDKERYLQIQKIAASILAEKSKLTPDIIFELFVAKRDMRPRNWSTRSCL